MARSATGSPQMFTDWDGLMDDLFHNREVSEFIQSPHESSSGIASESPTWLRPPSSSNSSLSTYKMGGRSSSPDTDEARAAGRLSRAVVGRGSNGGGYSSSGSSNDNGYFIERDLHVVAAGTNGYGPYGGASYNGVEIDAATEAAARRQASLATSGSGIPPSYELSINGARPKPAARTRLALGKTIDSLGDEALLRVMSHLPTDSLCRCARVCRRWYNLVWEPSLWTRLRLCSGGSDGAAGAALDADRALKQLLRRLSQETPRVCIALEAIDLSGCTRLTDRGLRLIARRCPELRRLELSGCAAITNMALCEVVSRCVNLVHLDTTGCIGVTCVSLTPEAAAASSLPHGGGGKQILLRYLDMTDCHLLEDTGLQVIASYCARLQCVYLRRCERVSDVGVQYLAAACASLRELSVSDCRRVTDFGVRELSARLELGLRYLSVAKCERVSDVGVAFVARHCRKLRYLNTRGCEAVSDDGVEAVARACGARLRSLDVGKCDVTDLALRAVARHCSQLRRLGLRGCDGVTDEGVLAVAGACRSLRELDVQGCRLSAEACRSLRRLLKGCVIEHTNPGFC